MHAGIVLLAYSETVDDSAVWFANRRPGDDREAETLERVARRWLNRRGAARRASSAVELVDGWQVTLVSASALRPGDGVLLVARDPDLPWSDAERELVEFAGQTTPPLRAPAALARADARANAGLDELTGLPDRATFLELVGHRVASSVDSTVAIFVAAIDGLSAVNDVLGHGAGNGLLLAAAARLHEAAGTGGVLARIAGNRFAVARFDLREPADALQAATALRLELGQPVEVSGTSIIRTATVGVAHSPAIGEVAASLLTGAVDACDRARALPGSGVRLHREPQSRAGAERVELERDLRRAALDGSLRVHYQPEIDLRSGAMVAVEALLRWQHPVRGLLEPGDFIDAAEQLPEFAQITGWVLNEALGQLAAWHRDYPGTPLTLRVNVPPRQLDDDLVRRISSALARHRVRAGDLCIEVVERFMPDDLVDLATVLGRLRTLGVRVAIDDLGTGRSTLEHLLVLPVDAIKIDRLFVSGLGHDTRSTALVDALIRVGRACGLEVVAEGVETEEQAAELVRLRCFQAQGYLLARPVPAEDMRGLLGGGRHRRSDVD